MIFAHIPQAHLIHDDLIVAAKSQEERDQTIPQEERDQTISQVMQAISRAGLTLNSAKCQFGKKEISFWGMIEDAHISGLGAMLAQGDSVRAAKPGAVAARTTNPAEKSILSLILKQQDLILVYVDLGIIW